MVSTTPAFNLKVVLKETGLAADTLRAWERRYGLPAPRRSTGGHRLYSQRDIETIKWLIARQTEGLSISRAVGMWNEQIASGKDPLSAAVIQTVFPSARAAIYLPPETSLDTLRSQWLAACLNFNETDAEQALNQAFAIYPVEAVCTGVLQRGLSEIGIQWYENRVSVQQEHFASALAMRRVNSLLSAAPPPTRSQTVIVGCAPKEWHAFTPLLISLFLRRRGFNVIYLGANVPADQFQEMVAAAQADLVVLVAQQLITAATLQQTAQMLNAQGICVGFGGRIFNLQSALCRRVAGHFLGETIEAAIGKIESLVTAPSKSPEAEAIAEEYISALVSFQSRRPQIEATLIQSVGALGFSMDVMETATKFLGENLAAALKLGDVTLIDSEIDWVTTLLKSNHIPEKTLHDYMALYAGAVNQHINGAGKPLIGWLRKNT